MTYMLWMMLDMKTPLPENIRKALEFHEKKYGKAPNIVECSNKLKDVPTIENVQISITNIPTNILLVGVSNEK